jgi:hypothetical protein
VHGQLELASSWRRSRSCPRLCLPRGHPIRHPPRTALPCGTPVPSIVRGVADASDPIAYRQPPHRRSANLVVRPWAWRPPARPPKPHPHVANERSEVLQRNPGRALGRVRQMEWPPSAYPTRPDGLCEIPESIASSPLRPHRARAVGMAIRIASLASPRAKASAADAADAVSAKAEAPVRALSRYPQFHPREDGGSGTSPARTAPRSSRGSLVPSPASAASSTWA